MLWLTVSATGTEGGDYCQCNRDRFTADRLLLTIAIAEIDIQHYTLTAVPSVPWGFLSVQLGHRVGLTVSATGTDVGLTVSTTGTDDGSYFECKRHRAWELL